MQEDNSDDVLEMIGFTGPTQKNISTKRIALMNIDIDVLIKQYIYKDSSGKSIKCIIGTKSGVEVLRATLPTNTIVQEKFKKKDFDCYFIY